MSRYEGQRDLPLTSNMGTIMAAVAALLIHMELKMCFNDFPTELNSQESCWDHEAQHDPTGRRPGHHQGSQGDTSVQT